MRSCVSSQKWYLDSGAQWTQRLNTKIKSSLLGLRIKLFVRLCCEFKAKGTCFPSPSAGGPPPFVPYLRWRTFERPSAHQLTFGEERRAIVLLSALRFCWRPRPLYHPSPRLFPLIFHGLSPSLCPSVHWARLELGVTSRLRGSKTIGIVRVKSENAAKRGTILGQFGGCVCMREDFPSLNWRAPLSSAPIWTESGLLSSG